MAGRRALVAIGLGLFAALALPATPAHAHAALMHASPAAGAILDAPPAQVVLRFSEPVRPVAAQTKVLGPGGVRADVGTPEASGLSLVLHLGSHLPDGSYLVSYRIVSVDGHPVAGGYPFSVGVPSAGSAAGGTPTGTATSASVDPVVGAAMPVVRYLSLAGLLLLVGPALMFATLWPARLSRRGPARLLAAGAVLLATGTAGELYLQAPYASGDRVTAVSAGDLVDVLDSRVGVALLVRLGALALAVPLLVRLVRRGQGARLLAPVGVLAILTWPFSGHAGSSTVTWLTVLTDSVHVAAMAVWLGGLVVLLAFLLRRASGDELSAILPIWSGWALTAVGALGLAGLVQAVVEVGTVNALLHTRYGLLLMAKAGVFAVILGAAAVARRSVRRAALPRTRLRRAVATELTLAAVVLGLTAVLVQTVPARAAVVRNLPPYSATLATKIYSLRVLIAPATVGDNTVELAATTPDGKPLPVQEWFATASLPSRGVAPVTVAVRRLTDDRAAATVTLPVAGRWRFRFALRISEIDEAAVTGTVTVR